MFTLTDVLSIAVTIEENGEASYRRLAARSQDPEVKKNLLALAEDEARHALSFAELKGTLGGPQVSSALEKMSRLMLKEAVGDQTFGLETVDAAELESVADCLALAAGLEEDTILFYETLEPFLPPDPAVRAGLLRIIGEERGHKESLEKILAGP